MHNFAIQESVVIALHCTYLKECFDSMKITGEAKFQPFDLQMPFHFVLHNITSTVSLSKLYSSKQN